jgi:hypothetical protein
MRNLPFEEVVVIDPMGMKFDCLTIGYFSFFPIGYYNQLVSIHCRIVFVEGNVKDLGPQLLISPLPLT